MSVVSRVATVISETSAAVVEIEDTVFPGLNEAYKRANEVVATIESLLGTDSPTFKKALDGTAKMNKAQVQLDNARRTLREAIKAFQEVK